MIRLVLALAFTLLPSLAWAQPAVTYADKSGTITSGGVAQTIAPAWTGRRGCWVQNQSSGDLWLNTVGTAAATQPSIWLPAGAFFSCHAPPSSGALSLYGATTGQAFSAREW